MAPISDQEWAELVAHEIPKTSDPVIQSYLKSRRALVAEEQKHRSGILFPPVYKPSSPPSPVRLTRLLEFGPLTLQGRLLLSPGPVAHRQQGVRHSLPDTR